MSWFPGWRGRARRAGSTAAGGTRKRAAGGVAGFERDLARLSRSAPASRALLTALAWARGPGLAADELWVLLALALAPDPPLVTVADARRLTGKPRGLLVAGTGPSGERVCRLADPSLAAHLRGEPGDRRAHAENLITRALLASVPRNSGERDWAAAHPYVRSFLGPHAAAAGPGVLASLAAEPGFLAAADPVRLGPLLCVPGPDLREVGRVYQRARPLLGADPAVNAAYLAEAALALATTGVAAPRAPTANGPTTNGPATTGPATTGPATTGPATTGPAVRPAYRTHLATARRDDSILTLTGHISRVNKVAFGAARGDTGTGADDVLLASCGDDGTVRRWGPLTGAPVGEPLTGHQRWVLALAFGAVMSGGAERLLLASGSRDHTVRLWDPGTGTPVGEPLAGHEDWVWSVAFGTMTGSGPGGEDRLLLASAGRDLAVRIWEPLAGGTARQPLARYQDQGWAVAFGRAADGRLLLACGGHDNTVRVLDPLTGTPVCAPLTGHGGPVWSVAFGTVPGDGRAGGEGRLLLASGSRDRTVRLWDPLAGTPVGRPLAGHRGEVWSVAFGTARGDGEAEAGERLLLASASDDQTIRLWDPLAGAPLGGPLAGHTGDVNWVAFGTVREGGEGRERLLLASGGDDQTVRLWDPLARTPAGEPDSARSGAVTSVALGAAGARALLASVHGDQTAWVRDPCGGTVISGPLHGHTGWIGALAMVALAGAGEAGGDLVLLARDTSDHTVRIFDALTGVPLGPALAGHTAPVTSVAFGAAPGEVEAGGGRLLLASASEDHTVRVWDPLTGAAVGRPLSGHGDWVSSVVFGVVPLDGDTSAGRLLLASGGRDETVRLWDPLTGAPVAEPLVGHTGAVRALAFATVTGRGRQAGATGRPLLASAGEDSSVRLWEPRAGRWARQALAGHTDWVGSLAFTAMAGRPLLASAGGDMTIRLWEPSTGAPVMTLRRRSAVRCLAAVGSLLAVGDDEGLTVIELDAPRAG